MFKLEDLLNKKGGLNSQKLKNINIPIEYKWCETKSEYIYSIINDINKKPICTICESDECIFLGFSRGYSNFCSKSCSTIHTNNSRDNELVKQKIIIAWEKKSLSEKEEIIRKRKETHEIKYGKYFTNPEKAKTTALNTIDENGNNSFQRRVINSKQTKLEKYGDENYNNPDSISSTLKDKAELLKNTRKQTCLKKYGVENYNNHEKCKQTCLKKYGVDNIRKVEKIIEKIQIKSRKTKEQRGIIIELDKKSNFEIYKSLVYRITNKQELENLENFNKRAMIYTSEDAFNIDHKVSIKFGFDYNIPPYIIGNILNLEMIPAIDNYKKKTKCSIDYNVLIEDFFQSN